jgi:cytochrome c biogenesis protein ResB
MKKPVLAALAIVGVILGIMVYSMMSLTGNRFEVCIQFNGRNSCKIARGATKEDAIRTATTNACGELAGGVTDTLACLRSEPTKITPLE